MFEVHWHRRRLDANDRLTRRAFGIGYNLAGQQVAELANGQFGAGSHALTFDASGMASGIYFIHATISGHLDQVQKVMLVR